MKLCWINDAPVFISCTILVGDLMRNWLSLFGCFNKRRFERNRPTFSTLIQEERKKAHKRKIFFYTVLWYKIVKPTTSSRILHIHCNRNDYIWSKLYKILKLIRINVSACGFKNSLNWLILCHFVSLYELISYGTIFSTFTTLTVKRIHGKADRPFYASTFDIIKL